MQLIALSLKTNLIHTLYTSQEETLHYSRLTVGLYELCFSGVASKTNTVHMLKMPGLPQCIQKPCSFLFLASPCYNSVHKSRQE